MTEAERRGWAGRRHGNGGGRGAGVTAVRWRGGPGPVGPGLGAPPQGCGSGPDEASGPTGLRGADKALRVLTALWA